MKIALYTALLTCRLFQTFLTCLLMLFFVQPLSGNSCCKLPSIVTFTFIQIFLSKLCLLYWMASKLPRLLDTASKFALFLVSGLKDEKFIKKSKPTWKRKHIYSILESFEYICQISSKLILIILSYTISKLVHFLRHSVVKVSGILTVPLDISPCCPIRTTLRIKRYPTVLLNLLHVGNKNTV